MDVLIIMLVLSVPTFFILRWIFSRWVGESYVKNTVAGIATVLITPIIYVVLIVCFVAVVSYYPKHEFDRSKWISDKEKRYEMSKDIIDSKMLIGKSKQEVRQLLDDKNSSDSVNTNDSDYWSYYLGYVPSLFGIDPDMLDIHFKNGKVVRIEQHES